MKFSKIIKRNTAIETISGLFILLFVYTAISKLANIDGFISVLSRSPMVGEKAPIVAWTIPIIELLITCLLFVPKVRKWGMWASTILMLFFTSYLIYMIYFTPDLPCSCGGVLKFMSWKQHMIFNISFTLLGSLGIWLMNKTKHPSNPSEDLVAAYS